MIFKNAPAKLLDCRAHGVQSGAELFLVEGDSASLAVANLRDAQFQAVLPMQGKPMNAYKASPKKVQQNPLFYALQASIGAGYGAAFHLANCRYQRIVLLMDPDADGIHCGALMLLFFHRFMPTLLQQGMIELVRPPVGEVTNNTTRPTEKTTEYAYTDAQFMALINANKNAQNQPLESLKYRGLAGIAANTLAQLCINPQTRKTSVMGMQDAAMALEIFGGIS
jgi:DNA gyrase subunit B